LGDRACCPVLLRVPAESCGPRPPHLLLQFSNRTDNSGVGATEPTGAVDPACPRCGSAMVKRVSKQGAKAGKAFWGCTSYPHCRGVLAIDRSRSGCL
jgi:ssDNA-binding Zn-finger/Zn-ribbon topoisomerase 1